MNRNQIDLWRLLFMIPICLLHTSSLLSADYQTVYFVGGYIGVEFFFILSGYYLAAATANSPPVKSTSLGTETLHFTIKRARRLYPEFLLGFILSIILTWLVYHQRLSELLASLLQSGIYELLFLHMANPFGNTILSVAWYASALLLATFIIYPCLRTFPDIFKNIVAPILMLLYITNATNGGNITIGNFKIFHGIMGGTLRAISEIAWGCFLFDQVRTIQCLKTKFPITKKASYFFLLLEISCFLFVLIMSFSHGNTLWDFTSFVFLNIGIVICLAELDYKFSFLSNNILKFCADYSYALYMTHRRIINLTKALLPQSSYPIRIIVFAFLSGLLSLAVYLLCNAYRKRTQCRTSI